MPDSNVACSALAVPLKSSGHGRRMAAKKCRHDLNQLQGLRELFEAQLEANGSQWNGQHQLTHQISMKQLLHICCIYYHILYNKCKSCNYLKDPCEIRSVMPENATGFFIVFAVRWRVTLGWGIFSWVLRASQVQDLETFLILPVSRILECFGLFSTVPNGDFFRFLTISSIHLVFQMV